MTNDRLPYFNYNNTPFRIILEVNIKDTIDILIVIYVQYQEQTFFE